MSKLLLKAAKHVLTTNRTKREDRVVRDEDLASAVKGGTKYLGGNMEVRFRKLPFLNVAEVTVTDNMRGVRASRNVDYPKNYLNVYYAFSDQVFDDVIEELKDEIKAV